jgi:hypothetical protein
MNVDTIITKITEAETADDALAILKGVSRTMLNTIADQLYVEYEGVGTTTLRKAIVSEARA